MTLEFQLLDRPTQPALVVRTRTPVQNLPLVMGQAFGAIMQVAGSLGLQPTDAPFVAYHNMDMADLDVEIGFVFAQKLAGQGQVLAGEIPGGKAASCVHAGPYDQLGATYAAIGEWMQANGYEPTGVAYEFYLNDPQTMMPAGLLTRLVFPLK